MVDAARQQMLDVQVVMKLLNRECMLFSRLSRYSLYTDRHWVCVPTKNYHDLYQQIKCMLRFQICKLKADWF